MTNMPIIVIGISFTVIWLGTTFFIIRYIKRLKNDLIDRFSDTEKLSEKEREYISGKRAYKPFDFIKRFESKHLLTFIQQEHPQIIALVLAHLEADKASDILQNLPCELQGDVSRRIAAMDRVSPEVTRKIEQVLEKKLSALSSDDYAAAGGVQSIVEILNHLDSDSKDQIIKALEDKDPELTEKIRNGFMTSKKPHKKISGDYHAGIHN